MKIFEGDRLNFMYGFSRGIIRIYLRLFHRLKVEGLEYVPRRGAAVIASNHVSYFDPPAIGASIAFRKVHFMARDTLYKAGRLANWWFNAVGCIPLDRTKGDIKALKMAVSSLQEGRLITLFPEGTRSLDGQLQQPKGGVGFLMVKAEVPVVPAFVDGTFESMPKNAKNIRFAPITVRFGPPVTPQEFSDLGRGREVYEMGASLVMRRIAELGGQVYDRQHQEQIDAKEDLVNV